MAKIDWYNQTRGTEFVLIGFKTFPEQQYLLFGVFFMIYMVTMAGNILITSVVLANPHLHKPMYFFLWNLSFLEICYSSTILPRILASFISDYHGISFSACFIQFYCFSFLAAAESYLLSAMSYDRYVAICQPLHYVTLMNKKRCIQLSFASWMIGIVASVFTTVFPSQLNYCGPNEIDHFFCDYAPLLMLSCSDTWQTEMLMTVLGSACSVPPMLFTLASYVCIITTILRMPSNSGRGKAFSTCSSHLIVVSIFYGSLIIVYVLPKPKAMKDLNKVFSVFYTILTPMINPFIYTLRNREFKEVVRKALNKLFSYRRIHSLQQCTMTC
ncbi:olfactory receptor 2AP1-like [Heteronotia binoei]|uniref:olfactory receptor 2AP1-like n=1 Tax=Heteronotia binoei TaxID=13085 RepID=UPI00292DCC2E|nr:olfactory receptor 2AP1-like [Heteronotia binoei]